MKNNLSLTHYRLLSVKSGQLYEDTGWMLDPPGESFPSLLRAEYAQRQIHLNPASTGIFRYADWLPFHQYLESSEAPYTYKSKELASVLGLKNLWITFSGYWPAKGIQMSTCSFKELEAFSVCSRLGSHPGKILVVASAGNTARAFARVCSDNDIPLLLCVPEDNIDTLWSNRPFSPSVRLVCTASGSDYFDAIALSNQVAGLPGFLAEGGAKNIARRDGMGTTVLSAVMAMGRIPDYYFQAVGSGTGAIAAWEANLRLLTDGRFGKKKMKLMVAQNEPFTPMYDAWKAGTRELFPLDENVARHQVEQIFSKVLSNRKPPYGIAGGLFDALQDTNGDILKVSNTSAIAAAELFAETEGIDIHPAAAVALASLIQAIGENRIDREADIMINITGGGEKLFKDSHKLHYLTPDHVFIPGASQEEVNEVMQLLFRDIKEDIRVS
ncbi:MAG: cysteate synthase [Bacteroidales bacterium]